MLGCSRPCVLLDLGVLGYSKGSGAGARVFGYPYCTWGDWNGGDVCSSGTMVISRFGDDIGGSTQVWMCTGYVCAPCVCEHYLGVLAGFGGLPGDHPHLHRGLHFTTIYPLHGDTFETHWGVQKSVRSTRNVCGDGNVPYLRCSAWQPPASRGYWAL